MRIVLTLSFLLLMTTPSFAENICPDVQEAVSTAIDERNESTTNIHNSAMEDPEESRADTASCLGNISAIGDAFSLGVSIPSMDNIIGEMCNQVNSMIQSKINDVHNQVVNSVNEMGGKNLFKVYGTGGDYVVNLKGKLQ